MEKSVCGFPYVLPPVSSNRVYPPATKMQHHVCTVAAREACLIETQQPVFLLQTDHTGTFCFTCTKIHFSEGKYMFNRIHIISTSNLGIVSHLYQLGKAFCRDRELFAYNQFAPGAS